MTKKRIIIISIVVFVLALILVLFCAVFCVRRQQVTFTGERTENTINITDESIIQSANIRNGSSIFSLDRDKVIQNIETTFPYIKVIQVNLVSAIRVEITVRERYEMYYTEFSGRYYIVDEELKVLNIVDTIPTGLSYLYPNTLDDSTNTNILGITSNTNVCDFLGSENIQNITNDLYLSMCRTVMVDTDDGKEYVTRDDIKNIVNSIQFGYDYTIQDGRYDRVIISTSYGFTVDIGMPQNNLDQKVNVCFSTIDTLMDQGTSSGTIIYGYDVNGNEDIKFVP